MATLWFAAAVVGLAADRADTVPARGADRARGAARGRLRPRWCWRRSRPRSRASRARSPGCSSRSPGSAIALAGRAPARRGARDRRRAAHRRAQPGVPARRRGAVRLLGVHRDPDAGRGAWSGSSRASTGPCGSGRSCTRALAIAALRRPQPAGRQRHPARGAVRRARAGARALAARAPGRARWSPCPLLYWQWVAPVRDVAQGGRRSVDRAGLLRAAAAPSSSGRTATEGRSESRSRRRSNRWEADYVAPRVPARARLAAPARVRRLRSVHGRQPDRRPPTGTGSRPGVTYVAVPDAEPRLPLRGRGGAGRRRACPTCARVDERRTGASTAVAGAGLVRRAPTARRRSATLGGGLELHARPGDAGPYLVRSTTRRYWTVTAGDACVERDGDWTPGRGRARRDRAASRRGSASAASSGGTMLGIVLGLASSVAWGISDFLGGLQARRISALTRAARQPAGGPGAGPGRRADRRRRSRSAARDAAIAAGAGAAS